MKIYLTYMEQLTECGRWKVECRLFLEDLHNWQKIIWSCDLHMYHSHWVEKYIYLHLIESRQEAGAGVGRLYNMVMYFWFICRVDKKILTICISMFWLPRYK